MNDPFFTLSPDVCCILSDKGLFSQLNPAFEAILGYRVDELKGRHFTELVHPGDLTVTADKLESEADVTLPAFTNRFLGKDGNYRHLRWWITREHRNGPVYAIAREITGAHAWENGLDQRDNLVDAVTQSVKDPIIMLDHHGNVIFWNQAGTKVLGYEREEVLGRNLHQLLMPQRYHEQHCEAFKKFQQTGEGNVIGSTRELSALHKDGHEIPIELSLTAFKREGVWCSIGIIQDLRNRKQTEAELRKLSLAVEQSPVSIVITDTAGNIQYANPKTFETTGYEPSELMGQNPRVLKSGETTETGYQELWQSISGGKVWRGVFHNRKKNGDLYWELATIAPVIDSDNQIISYIAVKEDITDQKKYQDELIDREAKLRQANTTKDKLFSIIAHDLRGPVGNFLPILELLTDEPGPSESQKARLLSELKIASENTMILLENLLNWSKSQSEQIVLNPGSLEIRKVIEPSFNLHRGAASKKSIRLEMDVPEGLTAFADEESMQIVIRNLLSNAIKFSPVGGTVSITAGISGQEVKITIADQGAGMKPELIESLNHVGAFTSSRGTANEKGSGIGLVLVRDFVRKNGGTLQVESTEGSGSRFSVILPAERES